MSDRVAFTCNGAAVDVPLEPTESLLSVLRERLRLLSVKDGCAPQGQCGCCTVLVDGEPRVACVTPAERVDGRTVTTIEGLDDETRARLAGSFVAAGGSQCGFCTPGILMRVSGARTRDLDRALAAHLCRCTGWLTIYRAIERDVGATERDFRAAARRAELEGGTAQVVDVEVPIGGAPFADDTAPEGTLKVPLETYVPFLLACCIGLVFLGFLLRSSVIWGTGFALAAGNVVLWTWRTEADAR